MVLGLTQTLTEMSTKNSSCGKGGRCVGLTTLLSSCVDCLEIWKPQPPGTSGLVQACNGILCLYVLYKRKAKLYVFGVSKTFGEWYLKTNKTEDTNK
jgi:hypothetical protein